MKKHLTDYPLQYKFPVQWGDMDSAQHVNNLIYMRWAESARIMAFEHYFGNDFNFLKGVGPILSWQDCKYIFPMTYPDTAIIGVKINEILADRFIMETAAFSEKHHRIASIGKQTIMAYDYGSLKKVELPEAWVEGMRE